MTDYDKPLMQKIITDQGCPLISHSAGSEVPEDQAEYNIGAWMAAPVGATGRRSVCNSCVRKIRRREVTNYRLNEVTLEVTENPGSGK